MAYVIALLIIAVVWNIIVRLDRIERRIAQLGKS
jgi:hypothetical protein